MSNLHTVKRFRLRRVRFVLVVAVSTFAVYVLSSRSQTPAQTNSNNEISETSEVLSDTTESTPLARDVLRTISVKGRAPKTGYSRDQFGDGWAQVEGCDMRNIMLGRYLSNKETDNDGCVVFSGTLEDVYTGKTIIFKRGADTSDDVQIDHVVALSDAWQKGAQSLSPETRVQFANDPLNLIPVDGAANQKKGDSDAASWLPPNKNFRCQYVARQIAVKAKYGLWVTEAEQATMERTLNGCPSQVVPIEKK